MAMAISAYRWKEILGRHWLATAKRCGFGE